MDISQARKTFEAVYSPSQVENVIEYNGEFLALIYTGDPDESGFLPFFKITESGQIIDFSPEDYSEPLEVINLLTGDDDE